MTQDTWGRVQVELKKEIGKNNYLTWIAPLRFARCDQGVATFEVPTSFVGTWVKRNFGERILHHLGQAGAVVDRIEFSVSAAKADIKLAATPQAREIGQPSSNIAAFESSSPLDKRLTFDSFVVGKPNSREPRP